jgi:uncharacterized protein YegP (UPF0339 family)
VLLFVKTAENFGNNPAEMGHELTNKCWYVTLKKSNYNRISAGKEPCMSKFVIRNVSSGVKFDLKASNGEVILTSEVYTTEAACRNGVDSVKNNAPVANVENQTVEGYETLTNPKFEMYQDKAGEFRFRLKARNGQIIAVSEGYTAKAGCLNGIESVKKNAGDAEIVAE